jgi:hypothetical protein
MTDRRKMLEAELAKLLETLRIFRSTYIRDMALSNVLGKALTSLTDMREERERLIKAAENYLRAQKLILKRIFDPPEAWSRFADEEAHLRAALFQAQERRGKEE